MTIDSRADPCVHKHNMTNESKRKSTCNVCHFYQAHDKFWKDETWKWDTTDIIGNSCGNLYEQKQSYSMETKSNPDQSNKISWNTQQLRKMYDEEKFEMFLTGIDHADQRPLQLAVADVKQDFIASDELPSSNTNLPALSSRIEVRWSDVWIKRECVCKKCGVCSAKLNNFSCTKRSEKVWKSWRKRPCGSMYRRIELL